MKPVLVGLLAATAYSADTITYPGTYKLVELTGANKATCCQPNSNGVTVTQATDGTVSVDWTFATGNTDCPETSADAKHIKGSNKPSTATGTEGDIIFTSTVDLNTKSFSLEPPAAANGEFTLNFASIGTAPFECAAVLQKQASGTVAYPGVYEVTKKNGADPTKCCYPAGDVIVKQDATTATKYNLEWTFETTATGVCPAATGLSGKTITGGAIPATGSGAVAFKDAVVGLIKDWTLDVAPITTGEKLLDLGQSTGNPSDCSVSLTKRTLPILTAGTYQVKDKTGTDSTCCWPAGDIIISKDTTKVNLDWTFGETTGCTTTFKNQKITGGAIPDSVTGDVTFTDTNTNVAKTWTLDVPVTSTGDLKLDLNSAATGCSVTLKSKSTFEVSYTGVYEVETPVGASTKTCCYPDGDVRVTQDKTSKKVTVGWTFENTDDCYNADVKGKVISGGEIPDSDGDIVFQDSTTGVKKTWTLIAPTTADGKFTLDLASVATGCSAILDDKSGYLLGLGSLVALSLSYIVF